MEFPKEEGGRDDADAQDPQCEKYETSKMHNMVFMYNKILLGRLLAVLSFHLNIFSFMHLPNLIFILNMEIILFTL
jgi:hypothetical protein